PPLSPLFPYTTLFRSCKLSILFLQVARGHIVQARIAENMVEWIFVVKQRSALTSDHDRKLAFMLDLLRVLWQFYIFFVIDQGGRSEEHTSELQSRSDL